MNQELSVERIESRLRADGNVPMRLLWERFRKSGAGLERLQPGELERLRRAHAGELLARPRLAAALSAAAFAGLWAVLGDALGAALAVYALWFLAAALHRTLLRPWRTIAALELADMLRRPSFRAWLDATPRAKRTVERLAALGVGPLWDDPGYRLRLCVVDGQPAVVETLSPEELARRALREVLGSKEDGSYRPGRFSPNLKEGKRSVSAFLARRQAAVDAAREGRLRGGEALAALRELKEHLLPGSAGARYLDSVLESLAAGDALPNGVVEARVWARDPWTDLGCAQDFYSSASLRGDSLLESLDRRSKGALGAFGYLRNKSVSAMDFSTREGKGLRARLAAAVARDKDGREEPVLFVDAVEGRFEIGPASVRKAVEDYARAAGFARVLYHAFPLNRVPARFAERLARSGARIEEVELAYADCEGPEYLDAFGLPMEPFEYARPEGKVFVYGVDLKERGLEPERPHPVRLALRRLRGKALLWLLAAASLACLSRSLQPLTALWWLPGAALCAAALLGPRLSRPGYEAERRPPRFLEELLEGIRRHPLAVKMSYPERLGPKTGKLLEYFEDPSPELAPLFASLLRNVSVKLSHLEGAFRFMDGLGRDERLRVAGVLAWLWPRPEEDDGLMTEDREARVAAMNAALVRIDLVRRFVKRAGTSSWRPGALRRAAWVLGLEPEAVLELVGLRPRLLRGLWKPPRPLYAWPVPTAAALGLGLGLTDLGAPMAAAALAAGAAAALGTWLVSTRLPAAPGVLWYGETRRRLREAFSGWKPSPAARRMAELGVDVEQYLRARLREDKRTGVRVSVCDKRTVEGAAQFLTSSEEIGNCIALRNSVSWCLPALFDDETVALADVSVKGRPCAQLWMVAAERDGAPVLAVNSVEVNDEGARRLELLMPEVVEVLREVARSAGFREIRAGISTFGRAWLDAHCARARPAGPIVKIHPRGMGGAYYFDSFERRGLLERRWEFVERRPLWARAYALVFGLIERLKGNEERSEAMLDSARGSENLWSIPLESEPEAAAGPDGPGPSDAGLTVQRLMHAGLLRGYTPLAADDEALPRGTARLPDSRLLSGPRAL